MFGFFETRIQAFPEEPVTRPPQTLYAFCRYHTRGAEPWLLLNSVVTATIAVLEVMMFGFVGEMVDWLTQYTPGTLFENESQRLWVMGLVVLVLLPLLTVVHNLVLHQTLFAQLPTRIRWRNHRYMLNQSLGFYQGEFAGRVASKVLETANSVRETVMKLLEAMAYITVYFLTMLTLFAQADWRLLIPVLTWFVLYVTVLRYFVPRVKRASTNQADARSIMSGRIVDSYSNIQTVKLFSHSEREADYAREGMEGFLQAVRRQMREITLLISTVQIGNYLLVASVTGLSIYLWNLQAISMGAIAVATGLTLRLNGMAQWIMWEVSSLFENIGAVADGMATLTQPVAVKDDPEAGTLEVTRGEICFENVSFAYGKDTAVLKELNLNLKAGEKIGLVGRSGAGKSTLVNLLLRFYDPESGRILIDGQDIRHCTQDSLRAQIGMVSQDTSLLHRSIRENVVYGRPGASEAELTQALKRAEVDSFIDQLDDKQGRRGLDALVGDRGVKLSGGQRQRIAIARVLLKDAPILVLDEATSALDSEVEAAIQQSLDELMEGKTVIAIAHRLSTIAAMDRLIVMDQGRIVEQGTHAQLLEKNGIYANLWAHQTGGFLNADD
ncbi:ABC transporter ATP-binding protein [Granulosicoccaceae sp. 1_MG-2023]|nr:ABC transporter ATP-binding protein [Granulosicoccaceae sp. 1_MG-2023]